MSTNTFKNLFYILPLSLKIVMNFSLLSSKQETACQILTTTTSLVTQVVFFFHLSIIFRHVSLINTETLNLKQFWICVKLGQVWPLKVDETVRLSLILYTTSVYLVHSIAGLQSSLLSTYSTEDKFRILAVDVLTHLQDKSDLKWKISHFDQQSQ